MLRKRRRRDCKPTNIFVGLAIICVVVGIAIVLGGKAKTIKANDSKAQKEIDEINKKIEYEKRRSEELDEYGKYVNTIPYVEEVARDVFGLVYPDEKLVVPNDN